MKTRRDWLRVAGIALVAGLAGCGGSDTTETSDTGPDGEGDSEAEPADGTVTSPDGVGDSPRTEAPQISVECDFSGSPSIIHAGGDQIRAENLTLRNAGESASFVEQSPPVYEAGDTIVEGGSDGLTTETQLVWTSPSGARSILAAC